MAILLPSSIKISALLLLLVVSLYYNLVRSAAGGVGNEITDPTQGFLDVPLNESNFEIQRPYNVPLNQRYRFQDGVHRLWVYSDDLPHSPGSMTRPRTEIRIHGYDYSAGVWQFEGHGYVPKGTSGVCVMQVFGATGHATTAMLRVYNGSLYYYRNNVLSPNIYDRWFKLNVIHDVDASQIQIYIDDELKLTTPGYGGTNHYFKCGVYTQDNASHCMESRWKGIRVLRKT